MYNILHSLLHHNRVVCDVRMRGGLWMLWSADECSLRLRTESLTIAIRRAARGLEKTASLKKQTKSHDEDQLIGRLVSDGWRI